MFVLVLVEVLVPVFVAVPVGMTYPDPAPAPPSSWLLEPQPNTTVQTKLAISVEVLVMF